MPGRYTAPQPAGRFTRTSTSVLSALYRLTLKPYPGSRVARAHTLPHEADQYLADGSGGSRRRDGHGNGVRSGFLARRCDPPAAMDVPVPRLSRDRRPDALAYEHYLNQHVANDGTELTTAARQACVARTGPARESGSMRSATGSSTLVVGRPTARGKAKFDRPGAAGFPCAVQHIGHRPSAGQQTSWCRSAFVGSRSTSSGSRTSRSRRRCTSLVTTGNPWHGGAPPIWGRKQGNTVIPTFRPGKLRAVQHQRHELPVPGPRTVQGRQLGSSCGSVGRTTRRPQR